MSRREHVCGEYGLRGVGCADINWNNGLGMPADWGCDVASRIAQDTGWSNFLTYESSRSGSMVSHPPRDRYSRSSSLIAFTFLQCSDYSQCGPDQRDTHVVCGYEY